MKNLLLTLFASLSLYISAESAETRTIARRAAFDIGSAQVKIQVSDVDLTSNRITNVLLTDASTVPLREDLVKSLDGRLSFEIQNKVVDAISQLMKKAALFHPEAYASVATEALRLAKNSQELIERIARETGLAVTIISQEEEGILGFISAVNEADIDPDHAISWDLGGGSFQITAKSGENYTVFQGRLGKIPLKNALLKIQGKDGDQTQSPNPISKWQAMRAIKLIKESLRDIPFELRLKLNHPDVAVLGVGINPIWGLAESMLFDHNRILSELTSRLNQSDDALMIKDSIPPAQAVYRVSNLILAYGVMATLGIKQVHYVGTQGANAVGTLLSPQYWE